MNSNEVLYLSCHFVDANLTDDAEISFLGEIINYEDERQCLIIKWVTYQQILGVDFVNRDIEILLDAKHEDEIQERIKVRAYVNKHSFQVIHQG